MFLGLWAHRATGANGFAEGLGGFMGGGSLRLSCFVLRVKVLGSNS